MYVIAFLTRLSLLHLGLLNYEIACFNPAVSIAPRTVREAGFAGDRGRQHRTLLCQHQRVQPVDTV
jgi:hypothetical protein